MHQHGGLNMKRDGYGILLAVALVCATVGCGKADPAPAPARAPTETTKPPAASRAQELADAFIKTTGTTYELQFDRVSDEGATWLVEYTILKPTQDPGYFWVRVNKKTGACEIVPGK